MWSTFSYPQRIEEYILMDLIRSDKVLKLYKAKTIEFSENVYITAMEFGFSLKDVKPESLVDHTHGHILTSFCGENTLYFVLECSESLLCLEDLLRMNFASGIFEERLISLILYPILEEIDYYHSKNRICYSVTPSSVFLGKDGSVIFTAPMPSVWEKYATESILKTYLSPGVYDKKSDIWSFGILALELASGEVPKWGDQKRTSLLFSNQPNMLSTSSDLYSPDFVELIQLCCKRPKSTTCKDVMRLKFFTKHDQKDTKAVKEIFSLCTPMRMEKKSWIYELKYDKSPLDSCHSDTEETDGDDPFDIRKEIYKSHTMTSYIPETPGFDVKKGRFTIHEHGKDPSSDTETPRSIHNTDVEERHGRFSVVTPYRGQSKEKVDIHKFFGKSPHDSEVTPRKKNEAITLGRFHVKESSQGFPEEFDSEATYIVREPYVNYKSGGEKTSPSIEKVPLPERSASTPFGTPSIQILDKTGSTETKGRFKIQNSLPIEKEKYLLRTSMGTEFLLESGQSEMVKSFLLADEKTKDGKFKIKEDRIVMVKNGDEFQEDGDYLGVFTAQKTGNPTDLVNGDFKITSPRKVNGIDIQGKVGRFTIHNIADTTDRKKRKSGEKKKKLVSLRKSDEITIASLHNQIITLKEQNEKQMKLIEELIKKEASTEETLAQLVKEIAKLSLEKRK